MGELEQSEVFISALAIPFLICSFARKSVNVKYKQCSKKRTSFSFRFYELMITQYRWWNNKLTFISFPPIEICSFLFVAFLFVSIAPWVRVDVDGFSVWKQINGVMRQFDWEHTTNSQRSECIGTRSNPITLNILVQIYSGDVVETSGVRLVAGIYIKTQTQNGVWPDGKCEIRRKRRIHTAIQIEMLEIKSCLWLLAPLTQIMWTLLCICDLLLLHSLST